MGCWPYYLSVGEKITREQATEQTRQFVAALRFDLENQHTVVIDKVGSFSTNYEGKLIFEPNYAQNYDQEWYGLEEIQAQRSELQPNWLRQEVGLVQDTEVLVADEDSIVPLNGKSNVRWGWAAAAVLVCAASAASYFYQPNEHNLLSSLNPISLVGSLYQSADEVFDYPQNVTEPSNIKVVYFQENKPETAPSTGEELSVFEEDPTMVSTSPKEIEQPKVVVKPEENYFLIAGSFSGKKNAHKLKKQLQRLGFDDASVLEEKSGKWIKVSAGSYRTHDEAAQNRDKVDKLTQAESWVFHRK